MFPSSYIIQGYYCVKAVPGFVMMLLAQIKLWTTDNRDIYLSVDDMHFMCH